MNWQTAREELLNNEDVRMMIAKRAYHLSENRGFAPGHDVDDWFTAEREVVEYLLREREAAQHNGDHTTEQTVNEAAAVIESAIHEEPVRAMPEIIESVAATPADQSSSKPQKTTKPAAKKAATKQSEPAAKPKASRKAAAEAPKASASGKRNAKKPGPNVSPS